MPSLHRRRFVLAAAACGTLSACESWNWRAPEKGPLVALLPDTADNDVQATYQGLLRIRDQLGTPVEIQRSVGGVSLVEPLRGMAASRATMVIAYGSEAGETLQQIAADYSAQRFSLLQAEVSAPQSASYKVLHEQSAWLAGTAAGLISTKKIVGHIGDERSDTQLFSRAAFYNGLQTSAPQARFLSSFCTATDSANLTAELSRIAAAQIAAGAELIFHTLPSDDTPLANIARERRIPLIGRGGDWLVHTPGVYMAAAFADPGVAAFQAGQDLYDGLWKSGLQRRLGIENQQAVRLILAEKTPPAIQQRIGAYQRELIAGGYHVATNYDGPEFKI